MLSEKVSKFAITSILCTFPDSTPCPINRVLRDHHLSKSESVIKVTPLVHGVPTIITSFLFIRFWHVSNNWKA
jgi:hypothetical protein